MISIKTEHKKYNLMNKLYFASLQIKIISNSN